MDKSSSLSTSQTDDEESITSAGFLAQSSHTPQGQQLSLSWQGINAWITEESSTTGLQRQRQLVKDVSGIARPGQLLAIMGASGAGKTTLLNIISGRLTNYRSSVATEGAPILEGSIQLNSNNVSHRVDVLRRMAAFVEQDDAFPGFLNVEEHLWFHAKLRMTQFGTTDSQRKKRVATLLAELNLTKVAGTLIGFPETGMKTLSGGERKRLSVATELIANPPLLLLDEPTSGLDTFTSESVISALRQMAQIGKTVAFTIHQPSSELFSYFDRLLLLSEGRVCYHGDAKDAARFFAAAPLSRACPASYNPADFYIEVLSRPFPRSSDAADSSNNDEIMTEMEMHATFINSAFNQSEFARNLRVDLAKLTDAAKRRATSIDDFTTASGTFQNLVQPRASRLTQLQWSTWRAAKSFYRSPQWMRIRIGEMIAFSLLYGLLFFGLSTTTRGVMDRCGLLAQLVSLCCWDNIDAYSITLPLDRPFLMRDHSAGLYSLAAYFFGRQFVELPLIFGLAVAQTSIIAGITGLWSITSVIGAFQMLLACFLTALCASSFGYFIGFLSDNFAVQVTVRRIILTIMVTTNGYFLNVSTVPAYLIWTVKASFFFYATEVLFIAEWNNVASLDCSSQVDDSDGRCFANGREILDNYSYGDDSTLALDFGILILMVFILRGIALFVLYYRSYSSIWMAMLKSKFSRNRQGT